MGEQVLQTGQLDQESIRGTQALILQLRPQYKCIVLAALKFIKALEVETIAAIEDLVIARLRCHHPLEKEAVIATVMTLEGVNIAISVRDDLTMTV